MERKPYTVQDGHTIRSQGKLAGAGDTVHLGAADAERLLESGAVKSAGKAKAADAKTDTKTDAKADDGQAKA